LMVGQSHASIWYECWPLTVQSLGDPFRSVKYPPAIISTMSISKWHHASRTNTHLDVLVVPFSSAKNFPLQNFRTRPPTRPRLCGALHRTRSHAHLFNQSLKSARPQWTPHAIGPQHTKRLQEVPRPPTICGSTGQNPELAPPRLVDWCAVLTVVLRHA
jgi:hypothetical protein